MRGLALSGRLGFGILDEDFESAKKAADALNGKKGLKGNFMRRYSSKDNAYVIQHEVKGPWGSGGNNRFSREMEPCCKTVVQPGKTAKQLAQMALKHHNEVKAERKEADQACKQAKRDARKAKRAEKKRIKGISKGLDVSG